MEQALKGRVAVITGGGRGIGRAIAFGFAKEGASVAVASRTLADIQTVCSEIEKSGGSALAVQGDVRRQGDVERVVAEANRRFGHIDVLVNSAGIDGSTKPFLEVSAAELSEVLEANLMGTFAFSKAVVPHMVQRHQGNVINLSSGAGVRLPSKRARSITYTVSKFAVEGLTYAMGISLKDTGVNVNALKPGYVRTSFQSTWTEEELRVQAKEVGEPRLPEAVVPVAVYMAALKPGEMTAESVSAKDWYQARGLKW